MDDARCEQIPGEEKLWSLESVGLEVPEGPVGRGVFHCRTDGD